MANAPGSTSSNRCGNPRGVEKAPQSASAVGEPTMSTESKPTS